MSYVPNKWCIVKIDHNNEIYYKLFSSWSGSYLHGSEWRLNSGVVSCQSAGGMLEFSGETGSVYICNPENYGVTATESGVLASLIEKSQGKIELVDGDNDWVNFKWLTSKDDAATTNM